jgi:hypothetical protein
VRSRRTLRALLAACVALGLLAAPPARAQEDLGFFGYGVRAGGSVNPDQFTLGGYAKLGKVSQMFQFRPSLDFGFGDEVFTVIGNVDGQIDFVDVEGKYMPFVGGGLGIAYSDISGDLPSYADETDTAIGLNLYAGLEREFSGYRHAYFELRIGIDDLPDFKFTFGFGWF